MSLVGVPPLPLIDPPALQFVRRTVRRTLSTVVGPRSEVKIDVPVIDRELPRDLLELAAVLPVVAGAVPEHAPERELGLVDGQLRALRLVLRERLLPVDPEPPTQSLETRPAPPSPAPSHCPCPRPKPRPPHIKGPGM